MHSLRARDAVEQKHEVNKNKNTTMYAYSIKLLACAACMDNRKYAHGVPTVNSGPIYKISYDNLTIMPKLPSTYDGRRVYKTSSRKRKAAFRHDSLEKS